MADLLSNLEILVAETIESPVGMDLPVAETYSPASDLDVLVGPMLGAYCDILIQGTVESASDLDILVGPMLGAYCDVLIQGTADLTADLDVVIAPNLPHGAKIADLDVVIAVESRRTVNLDVSSVVGPVHGPIYKDVNLSMWIAQTRTHAVMMDVFKEPGVNARLDILVSGTREREAVLQVYIKSAVLRVGASAIYNQDGDEVESVLYVEDGEILHPEFIEDMTATLLYRNTQSLGDVGFNRQNGSADGTVTNVWIHPAHSQDLAVRYKGIIVDIGAVDFTVKVEIGEDPKADIPLGVNTLEYTDREAPRTEPSSYQAKVHHLEPAPEEIETLEAEVVLTLFKLNLLRQYGFLEVGQGSLEYLGGGNRLLSSLTNDGSYIFQPKDTLPAILGAHTRVEAAGSNLLANSNFLTPTSTGNPVPLGYNLTAPSSVTVLPEAAILQDYGVFQFRAFGSGPYIGPKAAIFSYDSAIALATLDPVTFSIMARTHYTRDDSIINDLKVVVSFRDATDVELLRVDATFDPATIKGEHFVVLQATGTPPLNTVAARLSVELESIEASDDITLYLMAPQFELGTTPTSRIVGSTAPTHRQADSLRFPQKGNIEFRRGSATMIFAPDYDGKPPQDVCLFDTRDAAGLNGFAVFHLLSGRLRFVVAGPVTPLVLDTNDEFSTQAGIFHDVTVSWGLSYREIRYNNEVAALDETSIVLPQAYNEWIWLFQTTTGTNRLDGEVASFEIRRDVIT